MSLLHAQQPIAEHGQIAVASHESAQRAAPHLEAAALRSDQRDAGALAFVRGQLEAGS